MPRHDCAECVDCRLSACSCLCHVFNRFYDRGAADVEARIDAAIARQCLGLTRAQVVERLRHMIDRDISVRGEALLLEILEPETKP